MTTDGGLFDKPERVDPWEGVTPSVSTELAVVGDVCLDCGADTREDVGAQKALFWMYGHGADELVVVRSCTVCPWQMTTTSTIEAPR